LEEKVVSAKYERYTNPSKVLVENLEGQAKVLFSPDDLRRFKTMFGFDPENAAPEVLEKMRELHPGKPPCSGGQRKKSA